MCIYSNIVFTHREAHTRAKTWTTSNNHNMIPRESRDDDGPRCQKEIDRKVSYSPSTRKIKLDPQMKSPKLFQRFAGWRN